MSKKINKRFIRGVPIYTLPNLSCTFLNFLKERKKKKATKAFPVCTCPVNNYLYFKTGRWITECDVNYKDCQYYKRQLQKKYLNDVKLIKKYILKYRKGIWLRIPDSHLEWIYDRIEIQNLLYLKALFRYYGYEHKPLNVIKNALEKNKELIKYLGGKKFIQNNYIYLTECNIYFKR